MKKFIYLFEVEVRLRAEVKDIIGQVHFQVKD